MNETELFEFEQLKRDVADLRYALTKKAGAGSADIKGRIVNPSSVAAGTLTINAGDISSAGMFAAGVVDQTAIGANAVGQSEIEANAVGDSELKYEEVTVNVALGATSGTGTATSGSIIIGYRPAGNVDALVDNIAISGTVVTVTLAAAATAINNFVVILVKV